jgi:hypothetical protein
VQHNYEVGYCKPPKHTQFKPGRSGNPKGRPRAQRNFRTVLNETLKEKVLIRDGEQTRRVSKLDALVQVTINKALKGDPKALASFIQLARPAGLMDEVQATTPQELVKTDDEAILAQFLARHGITTNADAPAATTGSDQDVQASAKDKTGNKK